MRILFITNLFPPQDIGGYEIECKQVADALFSLGHDIFVLTSRFEQAMCLSAGAIYPIEDSLELFMPFSKSSYSAKRIKKWLTNRKNYKAAVNAIEKFNPDIVYHWSPLRIGLGACRAVQDKKIPLAWRIGDDNLCGYVPKKFSWQFRSLYGYLIDRFVFSGNTIEGIDFSYNSVISTETKRKLIEAGVPLKNSEVIIKGIVLEDFPKVALRGDLISPVRLLYVGQLYKDKGVHCILEAANFLAEEKKLAIEIIIAGAGLKEYEVFLKNFPLEKTVTAKFLGKISHCDIQSVYSSCDILIFPSIGIEGIPAVLQEGMSSSLPIISTCYGGPEDFLVDKENALLFTRGDSFALKRALWTLIEDSFLRFHIAQRAYLTAQEKFSMKRYITATTTFLQKVSS